MFKTLTFVGLVLLVGSASFRTLSAPGVPLPRRVTLAGWLLLLTGSLLEVAATLAGLLGAFALRDFGEYLLGSLQGQAVLARLLLATWLLLELGRSCLRWPVPLLALALLVSVSWTSHGRAAGPPTLVLDVLHLLAMTVWSASVLLLAWQRSETWNSRATRVRAALDRTSGIGLWSVAMLALTGTLAALTHVPSTEALTQSGYGQALLVKVALFVAVVGVAALNRLVLMRRVATRPLRLSMRAESVLLVALLVTSGVLTSSAPPQPPSQGVVAVSLQDLGAELGGQSLRGHLEGIGRQGVRLRLEGWRAAPPSVVLEMLDHPMQPVTLRLERRGDALEGTATLWMAGSWQARLEWDGQQAVLPFLAR
nr:CopD family protein [Deinobacterium chartae]